MFTAACTVLGLEEGKECIIVGTLYKDMKLKPSILDEYSKEVLRLWLHHCLKFYHLVKFSLYPESFNSKYMIYRDLQPRL